MPSLCPATLRRLARTAARILLFALARTALFTLTVMPAYVVQVHRGVPLDFPSTASVRVTHAPRADDHARRSPHP